MLNNMNKIKKIIIDNLLKTIIIIGIFIISLLWVWKDLTYEPAIAFLTSLIGLTTLFVKTKEKKIKTNKRCTIGNSEREDIINAIEQEIKKILPNSLIEISMQKQSNQLISHSVNNYHCFRIEQEQKIINKINMEMDYKKIVNNNKLLIVGDPASGKSTVLLILAKELLSYAKREEKQQIPILLDLITWKEEYESFDLWIVKQLKEKYGISRDIGERYLPENKIFPLLDGLDELETHLQEKCVQQINIFNKKYRPKNIVVTSRKSVYELLNTKLELDFTINIMPISEDQAAAYLNKVGRGDLWTDIKNDNELINIFKNPLFIKLFYLSYNKLNEDNKKYLKINSHHLLDTYIDKIFKTYENEINQHKRDKKTLDRNETMIYLGWIARKLKENKISEFMIEQIQPTWLPNKEIKVYSIIVGIVFGLVLGFISALIVYINEGFFHAVFCGAFIGITSAIYVRKHCVANLKIKHIERLSFSFFNLNKGLNNGFFIGTQIGASLIFIKVTLISISDWMPIDLKIIIKWLSIPVEWIENILLLFYLHIILSYENQYFYNICEYVFNILIILSTIFMSGIIGAILSAIVNGLSGPEIEKKIIPNYGVKMSGYNSIVFFVIGSIVGAVFIVLGNFADEQVMILVKNHNKVLSYLFFKDIYVNNLNTDILMGMFIGSIASAYVPVLSLVQHYIIRLLLWKNGNIPFNIINFLSCSVVRNFLQQVGGKYRFIHSILQEHIIKINYNK